MTYRRLRSKAELGDYLDILIESVKKTVRKTNPHAHTSISLVNVMLAFIESENLFLLIAENEEGFQGFIMAMFISDLPPWVEFLTMWARPGVAVKLREEAHEILKGWARVNGATRINATITRSADTFYKFFHEPLGYKIVGHLLEVQL